jgi:serine/threonine-protein kinase PknG
MVPKTSRGYPESRQLRADVLLSGDSSDLALLDQAMRSIESVPMDPRARETYTVRILEQALDVVLKGAPRPDAKVGAHPATEAGLRDALERSFRSLARDATELRQRVELVNQANAVRMWTLT